MKITYLKLHGFKRFGLTGIRDIEIQPNNPILVVTGVNGAGKTSLLREMSPLPAVRTNYDKDGYKEIRISHEGNLYTLTSDFSNRVSPHSFKMNGEELNVGGTTDIQEELCEKHFGINSIIRNIIFGKTKVCSLGKAERKNLFLNINPMDLSLILATYKTNVTKFKEAKAQLQHLYSRRSDIESKLISKETLQSNIATKTKMDELEIQCETKLNEFKNQVQMLRSKFSEEISFYENNKNSDILNRTIRITKELKHKADRYRYVPRGDEFTRKQENINVRLSSEFDKRNDLTKIISSLSSDIDEYNKHLENSTDRPITKLEEELKKLEHEINSYGKLTDNPIPEADLKYAKELYKSSLSEILNFFSLCELDLIDEVQLSKLEQDRANDSSIVSNLQNKIGKLIEITDQQKIDIENFKSKASIPESCKEDGCGLRNLYLKRNQNLEETYFKNTCELHNLQEKLEVAIKKLDETNSKLKPYEDVHYNEQYQDLKNIFIYNRFLEKVRPSNLIEALKNPTALLFKIRDYIEESTSFYKRQKLIENKAKLETELKTILSTSGANTEFIKSKLEVSKKDLNNALERLSNLGKLISKLEAMKSLYSEYETDINELTKLQSSFDKYSKGLEISKSCEYLIAQYKMHRKALEELRIKKAHLSNVVREQDNLRSTYDNEIIKQIEIIEKDKKVYEVLEKALSPTTGFVHRSMVKYLNSVINNVNYFISQIWTYPMRLCKIKEDQAIDYGFKIEIGDNVMADISMLSDGQTEVVNLAFVLTILLQLKMLDKVPLYADEIGRTFDSAHRVKVLKFLNRAIDTKLIEQMILVNHFSLFINFSADCDIICLSPDRMSDLPNDTNNCVKLGTN